MPYFHVKDFKRGLDTRRMVETTEAGSLIRARNCVITRGGEIERRRAWHPSLPLPPNTHGLYCTDDQIFGNYHVFGTEDIPASEFPPAVTYHKITHKSGANMSYVRCVRYFLKKFFVIATFDDGSTYSFYDGVQVVEDPTLPPEIPGEEPTVPDNPVGGFRPTASTYLSFARELDATTDPVESFDVTFISCYSTIGNLGEAGGIRIITICDTPITIDANDTPITAAEKIAEAINAYEGPAGEPSFNARNENELLYVSFDVQSDEFNNYTLAIAQNAQPAILEYTPNVPRFTGGVGTSETENANPAFNPVKVRTDWKGNYNRAIHVPTQPLEVGEICFLDDANDNVNDVGGTERIFISDLDATGDRATPIINAGSEITFTGANDFTVTLTTTTKMEAHPSLDNTYTVDVEAPVSAAQWPAAVQLSVDEMDTNIPSFNPGIYALQHKSKMFAVTGTDGLLRSSAVQQPNVWALNYTGADFLDFSISGGRNNPTLTSLGVFQDRLAIFAAKSVYVWNMEIDLAQSSERSIVHNTGTVAPNSVVEFGNTDLYYLDQTGVRSLQARELTGAAFSSDIGNPVDDLVREAVSAAGFSIFFATAVIDPEDGRYVLTIGNQAFVFNYYQNTDIAAWTIWDLPFEAIYMSTSSTQMAGRDANTIWLYGKDTFRGYDDAWYDPDDDNTITVQLPYLSAEKPATHKDIFGLDVALENEWTVEFGTDYTNPDLRERVGLIGDTTFSQQRVAMQAYATHVSFHLRCEAKGYARIGNLIWHFRDGEEPG